METFNFPEKVNRGGCEIKTWTLIFLLTCNDECVCVFVLYALQCASLWGWEEVEKQLLYFSTEINHLSAKVQQHVYGLCLVTSWPFANLYYPPKLLTGCHFNPNISLKFLKKDSIFFSKVHAVHIFIYIISILLEKCITKSCVWFLFYIKKNVTSTNSLKSFWIFSLWVTNIQYTNILKVTLWTWLNS